MIQLQQLTPPSVSQEELLQLNAQVIGQEVAWFQSLLDLRFKHYFEHDKHWDIHALEAPNIEKSEALYAQFINRNQFDLAQRLCLILAMLPHIKPEALDTFFIRNKPLNKNYTEFGGWTGKSHSGFLPTVETYMFILAGSDLASRFRGVNLFDQDSPLFKYRVILVETQNSDEPFFSGALRMANDYLKAFTTGVVHKPDFNMSFPAKRLTSSLRWDDLVLAPVIMEEINQLLAWIKHHKTVMQDWALGNHIKPGFRALFYGPPGTGKSLTATLLGKQSKMDVYRVDLSSIVSKYIGETEKNLAGVFDQAENKNWILFFDEADALFSSRTQTQSSNDRHANQQVSYLLQRIEDFPGVVILASNLKDNIDKAFIRRFQSVIFFPLPTQSQRKSLWKSMLSNDKILADDVDIQSLASDYELSGGAMTNVLRNAALLALRENREQISQADLIHSVVKEMRKEGKSIT